MSFKVGEHYLLPRRGGEQIVKLVAVVEPGESLRRRFPHYKFEHSLDVVQIRRVVVRAGDRFMTARPGMLREMTDQTVVTEHYSDDTGFFVRPMTAELRRKVVHAFRDMHWLERTIASHQQINEADVKAILTAELGESYDYYNKINQEIRNGIH